MNFNWSELAFGSKKPLDQLRAIFIPAPRELSAARFIQLIKTYLPQGNIILGLAQEEYIAGFEGQPQFKTLRRQTVQKIIDKVNAASPSRRIATLTYFQRDTKFILEKLDVKKVVLVNGSWKHIFHTLPAYYVLAKRQIPYATVSPFVSEEEARRFDATTPLPPLPSGGLFTAQEMLQLAARAATHSYDNGYQTGVTLGHKKGRKYELLAATFNKVVPFQTYAWHYGPAREVNFSPMHDLNHYDTVHAEVEIVIAAQKQRIDLHGTTLFINLLPCPTCARMFSETDIPEFVYVEDHSDGYGVKMLELAGKKVKRIVG